MAQLDAGDLTQIREMVKQMIKEELSVEVEMDTRGTFYGTTENIVRVNLTLDGELITSSSGSIDV